MGTPLGAPEQASAFHGLQQSVIVAAGTFHLQFPAALRLILSLEAKFSKSHSKCWVPPAVQMCFTPDELKTAIYRRLASSDSRGVCKYLMSTELLIHGGTLCHLHV